MRLQPESRSAFTLVEILIVVVILGILSAIVVPQFASATQAASTTATFDQLQKIRRGIQVYSFRNSGRIPDIAAGDGTWGSMLTEGLLRQVPVNHYVGGVNSRTIVLGTAADSAAHSNYGWIYNPATGDLWAASFDADDQPIR